MADDLERTLLSTEGDGPRSDFVAALRERIVDAERTATKSDTHVSEAPSIELHQDDEESTMTRTRWMVAAVAASTVALAVGLVLVRGGDGEPNRPVDAPDTSTAPPTTATVTTAAQGAAVQGADADAGCGLSATASIIATVAPDGESVTFDVTSDPDCAGAELIVFGTPSANGFPIERRLTLDDTGGGSISDDLVGDRRGEQEWSIELLVAETGGLAATTGFEVTGVCDFDDADLRADFIPETREIDIVLVVGPGCAGRTFTFDDDNIFASSPPGGWEVYTVDQSGRIEVTEQLVVDQPVVDVKAMPAPEGPGFIGEVIAQVTLDVTGS